MNKLQYNVFYFNFNHQKVEVFNIFNHYGFMLSAKKVLLQCNNIKQFSDEIKIKAKYYFWSKCEWEILISPWVGCAKPETATKKIDVYNQLEINWDIFVTYLWNNREVIINEFTDEA